MPQEWTWLQFSVCGPAPLFVRSTNNYDFKKLTQENLRKLWKDNLHVS